MKSLLLVVAALAAGWFQAPGDYTAARARAEELHSQGSFELARRAYAELQALAPDADEARWVRFRIADTRWRSTAASQNADTSELEAAKAELDLLQRERADARLHDRTWAEVEESLGDFHWTRRDAQDLHGALPHYRAALEWWGAARDIEAARVRYAAIVTRMARPHAAHDWNGAWWAGQIPLELLENLQRIARDANERAQADFLFAQAVRQRGGDHDVNQRALDALRAAIARGQASAQRTSQPPAGSPAQSSEWYDDALFLLAQWLEQSGEPRVLPNGNWVVEPDYVQALAAYRRITSEFKKGTSAYVDAAREAIARIEKPELELGVAGIFLPGSQVAVSLSARNVARVDCTLFAVDLTRAVAFDTTRSGASDKRGSHERSNHEWLDTVDLARAEPLRRWSVELEDDGAHRPLVREVPVDPTGEPALRPGAYVLEARGSGARTRELVLVGTGALVMKTTPSGALVWFLDALTSVPIEGARVRLFEKSHDGNAWRWRAFEATTGPDGTAQFALNARASHTELFACAARGDAQAFCVGNAWHGGQQRPRWRIDAVTDRSTYRPGDLVQWKVTARTSLDGRYATPADARLELELVDPRGTRVHTAELVLNAFGSAWGSFESGAELVLGEYQVQFHELRAGKSREPVGSATLFRLEEYKLPEFEVTVAVPEVPELNGPRKLHRTGERVEVAIEARTYYGAPVAGASVEALVLQRPHWSRPIPLREHGWLYADHDSEGWRNWNQPQIVERRQLQTDAQGRALLAFSTPRDASGDLEYTIEARVIDASRREITGRGTVVVARLPYAVTVTSARNVYRPDDRVQLTFSARDANGAPVAAQGEMTLARRRWVEVWLDPTGREVRGAELERLRASGDFPPPAPKSESGGTARAWRLKSAGYVTEEIARAPIACNAQGEAVWETRALAEGSYHATWSSRDERGGAITAAAEFLVASGATRELGYHPGGLDLIVDQETFRAGGRAIVLIATPHAGRRVLLSVECEALHSWQVVHVEGTVKFVELAIGAEHVPNCVISALTTDAGEVLMDTAEIVVPPVEQFLTVEVATDAVDVQPGERATLRVTTRDHAGEPVAAEVSLAVSDAAIAAIQGDYARDPRQVFYGERKALLVQTHSTFEQQRFVELARDAHGVLRDTRQARRMRALGYTGELGEERDDLAASDASESKLGALAGRGARAPSPAMRQELSFAKEGAGANMADMQAAPRAPATAPDAGITVRSNFSATALWKPDLVTDARGEASIEVRYPDSLTRWQTRARAASADARFGAGALVTRTHKPLMARLQAPRFLVVGDTATIAALIDNRTDDELRVEVTLGGSGYVVTAPLRSVRNVAAQSQQRVEWQVSAHEAGTARFVLSATSGASSDAPSDAMEQSITVHPHGIDALVARSAKLTAGESIGEIVLTLDVPAERRRETTRMEVQVSPSLAVAMLDALPYLIDYPYGCTEQTLSRFVPASIVAKTLAELGIPKAAALERVFGGIEPEHAGKTHPKGKRALTELDAITRASLERLRDFQHADGGWGWWKEGDSDHYMSAYVVWGLSLARDAGVAVDAEMLERGAQYLALEIVEEERNVDIAAWMLHALAAKRGADAGSEADAAFARLWQRKDELNAFGKALCALAAHALGRAQEARTLVANLANGAQLDADAGGSLLVPGTRKPGDAAQRTAHWGADRLWWRWSEGGVETTSFVLRALLAIDPKNELVEPTVAWLIQNRRGAQWNNTRDSAIALLALGEYLEASGELARDVEYELTVNGRSLGRHAIAKAQMLQGRSVFEIESAAVVDGPNEVRLKRVGGEGPLYLSARATFFSLEEPIPARGHVVFAQRRYFKLVGRPTLLAGLVYERVPLADLGQVKSGERVEVVLTLEAKNDLEYLLFEDLKPAGLEAVQLKSGEPLAARELKSREFAAVARDASLPEQTGDALGAARFTGRQASVHQELRERKVALFIDKLPQGVWELGYELRAEVPGSFHALPLLGGAMYVPEIVCNGDELRLEVLAADSE